MSIARRAAVSGTALLALLPSSLAANPATAAASHVSAAQRAGKAWVLRTAQDRNQVVDVWNGSTSDGADVVLFPFVGGNNQKWEMIPDKGGWFQLKDLNAGKCLTSDDVKDNALVTNDTCQDLAGQLWAQVGIENTGKSTLVNKGSGKCMEQGPKAGPQQLALLEQFACTGKQTELWEITAAP